MTSASTPSPGAWRRFTAGYAVLLDWLLAISVAVLVFPVTLQIFSRFTDLLPHYIWTEEMARLLFVWVIMIGAMIGVREGTHFVVDVWPSTTGRFAAGLRLFASLCVLGLAGVFLWFGLEFTRFGWNRISELAELPLWIIHAAWPLSGFTWIVFLGEHIVDQWREMTGSAA
jgi:TRAP-type C4-dicarboxylate transport system permease small subunit